MILTKEAEEYLKYSVALYEDKIINEIKKKYKDTFRAVNKKDVEEAIGRVLGVLE